MSFTRLRFTIREIEYSCSPGGVDTWELYSLGEDLLKSSENLSELVQWVTNKYSDYEIDLNIKSLNWWHKEQEKEAN